MSVQILNLTTKHRTKQQWDKGLIELSRRDHELLSVLIASRDNCTSFSLPYLRVIKEIVDNYEIDAIYIEDELYRPGVVEMFTLDCKKPVILLSDRERGIKRFSVAA